MAKLDREWPPLPTDQRLLPPAERSPELAAAYAEARRITRHHAKSFYFASFRLPREKRDAAYAIYAFCRLVDDRIDEAPPNETPTPKELQSLYQAMMRGECPEVAFAPAFAETNRVYAIPDVLYEELIHGCCLDREPAAIANFAELEMYCYYVASVVGLIMSRVFGLERREERREAIYMGIAMQLTNILRDVQEDWTRGRVYLAADELAQFGLDREAIAEGTLTPEWRQFMRFQIERTRQYYAAGAKGLPALANDGSRQTAELMAIIYSHILNAIEANDYDVFAGRVFVPTRKKLWLALRHLLS